MQGWIKLHRQLVVHPLWIDNEPFDKRSAWIDLLLMANHDNNKFLLGSQLVEVERGSFITSKRKLSERWKWSNTKVDAFLALLESDKMITVKSDTKKTLITIDKYDFYQCRDDTETSPERHQNDAETTPKRTNKNEKNDKNEKKLKEEKIRLSEFVLLTQKQIDTLTKKFGSDGLKQIVSILNDYKKRSGKTYDSDYQAINRWVSKRYLEDLQKAAIGGKVFGQASSVGSNQRSAFSQYADVPY